MKKPEHHHLNVIAGLLVHHKCLDSAFDHDSALYELFRWVFQVEAMGSDDTAELYRQTPKPVASPLAAAHVGAPLFANFLTDYFEYCKQSNGFTGSLAHIWVTQGLAHCCARMAPPKEPVLPPIRKS